MPPSYKAYNSIEVIRPLIRVREKQIKYMVSQNNFPIIDAEGSCLAIKEGDTKQPFVREKIKNFLKGLEDENRDVFTIMEAGFKNISPETFLDKRFFDNNVEEKS
jgi:tRNA(Ile)-lysidine synthase TilS/MesJ